MDWGMMQDPDKVAQTACRMEVPSFSSSSSLALASSLPTSDKGHNNTTVAGSNGNGNGSAGACHHIWLRPRLRYGFTVSTLIVCLRIPSYALVGPIFRSLPSSNSGI